jgi:sugar phosphate isomerase/epimerase
MMSFGVSNIAWKIEDLPKVVELLHSHKISNIEIAPTTYFTNLAKVKEIEVKAVRDFWKAEGITITSLQSLLFNKPDLQLFGSDTSQDGLLKHLQIVGQIGEWFGAKVLVFGSPKNRLKNDLSMTSALHQGTKFFEKLFSQWDSSSPYLVIEANPRKYGADFLTNGLDAFEFVKNLHSDKMKWHLDFACCKIEGPPAVECLRITKTTPAHVHLSEVDLGPLERSSMSQYSEFLAELKLMSYAGVVTLEMKDHGLNSLGESIGIFSELIESL